MPSDTAKIKICKAKICFNGPILFPQTYRKKSVNDEADIIVCFFLFKLQNSVFTERCIYCKKDHINRRCFVCAADLFNLLHVLCMIYLNSCSVLRHVEEDCWINGVQKCLYTQQVVSFILRTKQSRCNRNGYTQQSVTGHTVRGIYNTKGGAGVLSSLISEACHQRGYYTWREWWWGFGDNCDSPSPAQFFLGRKKMVYWWLYGTKETVKACFCSWRGSQKKKKKGQLCFPDLLPGGSRENAESLWKVVEAHGHADVAGEADVDAEVDQPLFAWAWENERSCDSLKNTNLDSSVTWKQII